MKLPSKYYLVELIERTLEAHSKVPHCNLSVDDELAKVVETYRKVRRRKVKNVGSEVQGN